MDQILEQYNKRGDLHHFYILEGDKESLEPKMTSFLKQDIKIDCSDPQLFCLYTFDQFLVDHSREILSRSQMKTPRGQKMIFVIYANLINRQAQNALLKLFEEPSERTYFFLILPRVDNLLPTLISRAIVVTDHDRVTADEDRTSKKTLEFFREMVIADRIQYVDDLIKDIKEEKKEKIEAQKLIRNLIVDLESELLESKDARAGSVNETNRVDQSANAARAEALKTLMEIDDYLNDSGASTKILLERAILLI